MRDLGAMMQHKPNKAKAMIQDIAGYSLTILVVLFFSKRPMQNLEIAEWVVLTDKPLAKYLGYLEDHSYIHRTFAGWMLSKDIRQLDFLRELEAVPPQNSVDFLPLTYASLKGIGLENVKESESFSESESFLSTAPTTTTIPVKSNNTLLIKPLDPEESETFRLDAEELKEIKREIVKICLGESESYQRFVDDETITPEFVLGHYLQLMAADEHSNKAKLVEHLLNRPVHPDFYKQARKMIANGDY